VNAEEMVQLKKERAFRLMAWNLWLLPGDKIDPDAPLLTEEHEGRIMAEYGPDALYRYYTVNPDLPDHPVGTTTTDIKAGESGWVKVR